MLHHGRTRGVARPEVEKCSLEFLRGTPRLTSTRPPFRGPHETNRKVRDFYAYQPSRQQPPRPKHRSMDQRAH